MPNPNTVTISGVRLSYCNLFVPYAHQPNQEPKYSVTVLVPKSNTAAKEAIDTAVQAAIEAGVSKVWSGQRPPVPAICVHDGDGPRPSDGQAFGEECRGHWVFTASSKQQPFVVDANVQNIINPNDVYSGMYGNVNVTFFAYNNSGKKGIGCGLNGVQKTQDGEPLSGRVTAEEAFGAVAQPAAPQAPWGVPQQPAAPWGQPVAPAPQATPWGQPAAPAPQAAPWGAPQQQAYIDPITGQPYSM